MSDHLIKRSQLVAEVVELLKETQFRVSSRSPIKSTSFDLIARRQTDEVLFLLKILSNIDSLQKLHAFELKLLAKLLKGSPLLVGQRCRSHGMLPDGVVYERHGIPAVNKQTVRDILVNKLLPWIYAFRGGLYVKLNSNLLRSAREERNLSIGELAREIGVSKRAINDYERGEMDTSLETAIHMENILENSVFSTIDILKWKIEVDSIEETTIPESIEREVYELFEDIGLSPIILKTTPFDIFTPNKPTPKSSVVKVMTVIHKGDAEINFKRLQMVKELAPIAKVDPLIITEDDPKNIDQPIPPGIASMSIQELEQINERNLFIKTIKKKLGLEKHI